MNSIVKDVSTLTTIPEAVITKLLDKFIYCIVDSIVEDIVSGNDTTEVDIYLGILTIKHSNDEIRCRFTPSAKFNDGMTKVIIEGENILEKTIESTLKDKITKTYKDLL